ncbi:hypothetical protein [Niveibacterium sp.]|uniref:hypothetical protein n=1 Tax=Niveibacterium sp. TaxID=2017444 RepID=UPI0035B30DEF
MKSMYSLACVAALLLSAPAFACPGGDMADHKASAETKKSGATKSPGKTADKKTEAKKS